MIAGVASLVVEPSAGVVMAMAGATVSTVNVTESLTLLPWPSAAVATTVCGPSARSAGGVHDQDPSGAVVTVIGAPPSTTRLTVPVARRGRPRHGRGGVAAWSSRPPAR